MMKIVVLILCIASVVSAKAFGEKCELQTYSCPPGAPCPPPPQQYGKSRGDCGDGLVCYDYCKGTQCTYTCKYDSNHACAKDDECGQTNNVCYNGKCTVKGGIGQSCKSANDCYNAFVCYDGLCANRKYLPIGSKCKSVVECQYGCINGVCDKPSDGTCTNDSQCPSGIICWCGKCCGKSVSECREKTPTCL